MVSLAFGHSTYREGEKGVIIETVTNKKILPFCWGNIQYHVPAFIGLEANGFLGSTDFKDTISVFSYEQIRKTVPFTALRRGYYRIGTAELLTQDFFFEYRMIRRYPVSAEIYVYPDPLLVTPLGIDFKRITGEVVMRRNFIEDQFLLRGIRDYHPFDSFKAVNWNATARTGEIKVNQYDSTSSQEVYLLLDFDSLTSFDSVNLKEDVIRIAARLSCELLALGIPLGIVTNSEDIGARGEAALPCRNGSGQYDAAMRLLSRINYDHVTRPFTQVFDETIYKTRGEPQYILISFSAPRLLQVRTDSLPGLQWIVLREKESRLTVSAHLGLYVVDVI